MSVRVSSHVWHHSKQKGPRLIVLLAIADSANDDGFCWIGMPKLAKKTRQNKDNLRRYIQQVEAAGELIVYERKADDGAFNLSNLYKVVIPGTGSAPPTDLKGKIRRRTKQSSQARGGESTGRGKSTGGGGKSTGRGKSTGGGGESTGRGTGRFTSTVGVNLPPDPLQEPSAEPLQSAPHGATISEDSADAESLLDLDLSDDQIELYPCTPADINSLIAVWWDWIMIRPTKRGKILSAKQHFANRENRDYAQNLIQRGVAPADMALLLGDIRYNGDSRWKHLRSKEMTFTYAAAILEEWVPADRDENWYTEAEPRITPRRPGVVLRAEWTVEEMRANPDLIVDVPRPFISAQAAAQTDDAEAMTDDATLLAELEEMGISL